MDKTSDTDTFEKKYSTCCKTDSISIHNFKKSEGNHGSADSTDNQEITKKHPNT
jgi:hypothetical protein